MVVLTNYTRNANVVKIIHAFTAQSVDVDVVVVDNSPLDHPYADGWLEARAKCADIWRFRKNHGPPCRFPPALLDHGYKYVLFFDDDLIPGSQAIEFLLTTARSLQGRFSTIGTIGRVYKGSSYIKRNVRKSDKPIAVDLTCRAHFIHAEFAHAAIAYKWQLMRVGGAGMDSIVGRHDDILLCQGIQMATGWPSYLIPACMNQRNNLRIQELPANDSVSSRPDHAAERSRLIECFQKLGWRSKCSLSM